MNNMRGNNKIYLAKSNRSNPEHVNKVRQILENGGANIVEFKGGQYTHKPLLECDIVVVVPDLTYSEGDTTLTVGKGLHTQIQTYNNDRELNDYSRVLVVNEVVNTLDRVFVSKPLNLIVEDVDDYVDYSKLELAETRYNLKNKLTEVLGLNFRDKKISTVERKYTIIG